MFEILGWHPDDRFVMSFSSVEMEKCNFMFTPSQGPKVTIKIDGKMQLNDTLKNQIGSMERQWRIQDFP